MVWNPSAGSDHGGHMFRVADALEKVGLRVHEDVGLIPLEVRDREKGMSGIDQNFEQIGATAVHHVIGMFHRGKRGFPKRHRKRWSTETGLREARCADV